MTILDVKKKIKNLEEVHVLSKVAVQKALHMVNMEAVLVQEEEHVLRQELKQS